MSEEQEYTQMIPADIDVQRGPNDPLDMQYMLTEPSYSDRSEKFKEAFTILKKYREGVVIKSKEEAKYLLLELFTRDLRLGNLTQQDINYCTKYIDLALDAFSVGLTECIIEIYSKALTRIELSQSRNGFFRRRIGTSRIEKSFEEKNYTNKFFGGKKKND